MSKNLSGKIDKLIIRVISDLNSITEAAGVSYFVVGATARDIIYTLSNTNSPRSTNDIDFAIKIENWQKYDEFKLMMLNNQVFTPVKTDYHRFMHTITGKLVDVLPFGGLEELGHVIKWPPDDSKAMSNLGFEEAYDNSIRVRLQDNPVVDVAISTLAGLAIMKLMAWNDGRIKKEDDAQDLLHISRHYIDGLDILTAELCDLANSENFDYENASAELLGRAVADIADAQTMYKIIEILDAQIDEDSNLALVADMTSGNRFYGDSSDKILKLLLYFKKGVGYRGTVNI